MSFYTVHRTNIHMSHGRRLAVQLLLLIAAIAGVASNCEDTGEMTITCYVSVIEHAPNGTKVFDVKEQTSHVIFTHNAEGYNFNDHFRIEDEEVVYTLGDFDREEMVTSQTALDPVFYLVSFTYIIEGAQIDIYNVNVNISVIDLDDNEPQFYINSQPTTNDSYSFTTPETNNPKNLLTIQARDFDEGLNGTAEYVLGEGSSPSFNITSETQNGGVPTIQLVSTGILDREEQDRHNVYIIAREGTPDPHSSFLNITIHISDEDDNTPSFPVTEYTQVVLENATANTTVVQVIAEDPDLGDNGEINYAINQLCSKSSPDSSCTALSQPWPFVLDTESGVLTLKEMLNYEDAVFYRITIGAKNPNTNSGSSTAIVTVEVQDINDHAPKVVNFASSGDLIENAQLNSLAATFTIQDDDSDMFSNYHLSLLDATTMESSTTFMIKSSLTLYTVELASAVDREKQDRYDLIIVATDSLNSSLSSTYAFSVHIEDANDHDPLFAPVDNPILLEEESSVSTLVVQLEATDEDDGSNANIDYSLPAKSAALPYQDMFTVGTSDGKLHVYQVPDRETTPTLFLKVVARDNGEVPRSTEIILNITLTDINDQVPFFTTTILPSIQIKENETLGALVLDVDASDNDIGPNAVLSFSLSSSGSLPLSINATSGEIRLQDPLDHESTQQYTIEISVTDGVNTAATKSFNLIVLDVNDNNPYFPQLTYFKSLYENSSVNTYVVTVMADDDDSAEFTQLSYSFASGFDHTHFNLNSKTGEITTSASLDWESTPKYFFEVEASDENGRLSLVNANVTVTITDVNDEIPQFINEPYEFIVLENAESTGIGQVVATSKEQGNHGKPVYTLINTDPAPFSINPVTGIITPTEQLDREERDTYQLVVKVDDVAPPINDNTTTVMITVTDVNDNPPQFNEELVSIELSELNSVNIGFFTAIATDRDLHPNNVTVYSLENPNNQFQIDPNTGVLILTSSLNYEKQQTILVDIVATDSLKSLFTDKMQLNITVLDDNNTNITFPTGFPLQHYIQEDAPTGQLLLNFTAQDSKGVPQLHLNYFISVAGSASNEFGIDVEPGTGYALLTTAGELDREAQSSYNLNITITDKNVPPNKVTQFLTVHLSDVNDNPPLFIDAPFLFSIDEEQSGVVAIGEITADDPDLDENGTITFALQDPSDQFTIHASTGVLSQLHSLDRETQSTHTVVVMATDGGNPPRKATTSVTINVQDINDNSPDFSPYLITVEENIQSGTVVQVIASSDADSGSNGQVFFYRDEDEDKVSTATDNFFLFQNGTLVVIKVPDYEQQNSFIYYIKVTDNGSPMREKAGNITIQIKDLNDNAPVFTGTDEYYVTEVSESESQGHTILTVVAKDDDTGMAGSVNYQLESKADAKQFEINVDSGILRLRKSLDYETKSQHIITVLAYDNGTPRNWVSRQNVTINVKNEDDHNPYFDGDITFIVRENQLQQTLVGTTRAYDRDAGAEEDLTYELSQIMPEGNNFMVSQTQEYADITTLSVLDYEIHSQYLLKLTVTSKQKTAFTFVKVYVENLNDENPSFTKSKYSTSVSETSPIGTSVIFVMATDADNNTNNAVSYDITSGNQDDVFLIDSETGEVRLDTLLDYESKTSHTFVVTATDTGDPPLSATSSVTVDVTNENEHTPVFELEHYYFSVEEEGDDVITVGQVTALDDDAGNYGDVTYSFQFPSNQFTIDSEGIIKTVSTIDRETTPTISDLVVVATDSMKSSTTTVSITITDVNDNAPTFENSLYQFSIPFDQSANTPISKVTPVDQDLSPAVQYSIYNNTTPFLVNTTSGYFYLSSALPSDYKYSYKFTLVATDTDSSDLTGQTTIEIFTYTDTNHPPLFEQQEHVVNVTEEETINTPLLTVTATDADGDDLVYSLEEDFDKFSVNTNGAISLTGTLDYEDVTQYLVTVLATDDTSRTASAVVTVTVINVNDNPPQFLNPPSTVTLSPVSFVGVALFQLEASDPDGSDFTYTILSQTNKFSIDSNTGTVSNKVVLTDSNQFSLTFHLSDGTNTKETTVQVTVATPPAGSPSFTEDSLDITVSESNPKGFIVHTFTAIDPSQYNIVCCVTEIQDMFEIDSTTGVLSIKTQLDYETKTQYSLVIEAREEEFGNVVHADYQQVDITVSNVNEYTPTFIGAADKTVNEGLGNKALITQVQIEDDDSGSYGDVTFSIIQGNIGPAFVIDPSTGAINLAEGVVLDREEVGVYQLLVKATDGGGKLNSATVTITILDLNDSPPVFSSDFQVGMYETASPGARVAQVTATDADSTSVLEYSLGIIQSYRGSAYVGVATNMFKINRTTAVVTLQGNIDRETVDLYVVQVSCTDTNANTMTFLNVTVIDVNDNSPLFQHEYSESIRELSAIGLSVVTVMATDDDTRENGLVLYSLGDDWPDGEFVIDPMSGVIRVKGPILFSGICDKIDTFTSTVIATDGTHSDTTTVTIRIVDVNNNQPIFTGSPYTLSVSETAQVGDTITTFTITDSDCGINANFDTNLPSYYNHPYELFSFDNDNNNYDLKVNKPLVQGVYHFRIQAFNSISFPSGYYQAGFGSFVVTVLPENIHSPSFESDNYMFRVDENSQEGLLVGMVMSSDNDLGDSGSISYRLTNENIPFSITTTTGDITVNGVLDYESVIQYTFIVMATDAGYPAKSASVSVTIAIDDVNDNPPMFQELVYKTTVTENVDIGTTVLRLEINDTDTIGDVGSVRFSLSGHGNIPFTINEHTGEITTAGTIDYEKNATFELSAIVTDDTLTSYSSCKVFVSVVGVNEFPPIFPPSDSNTFVVTRDHMGGDYVGTVVAVDDDTGPDGTLRYSFVTTPSPNYFTLLSNGSIYLADNFTITATTTLITRKRQSNDDIKISLQVEVRDGGSPPQTDRGTVVIHIPEGFTNVDPVSEPLLVSVIGGIGGVVMLLIFILLLALIVGSVLYKNARRRRKHKLDINAENPGLRSSTRASTPGNTMVSEVELQRYVSRDGIEHTYRETMIATPTGNSESPDTVTRGVNYHPSPRTRSTSDLASSVATDTLNLTQEGGFQYSKGQIEQIYATNIGLLNDHSQDSVHMFGSEGGGEAEGDEMDDMMFAKYDLGQEDSLTYCDKSRHSLISESSEGARDEYQFSQSTNAWSSRHSIADRSMNEMASQGSRPGGMYHFEPSQSGPPIFGASTQGSTVSLTRSLHHRGNKYGSERDLPHHYPVHAHPPPPHHLPRYEYYQEMPPPRRYGSPIMEYRSESNKRLEHPPPPYLSQDPYLRGGHPYYAHMEARISPDPVSRPLPQYETLLSTSSTSLSTNASHTRGPRPYPLSRERY